MDHKPLSQGRRGEVNNNSCESTNSMSSAVGLGLSANLYQSSSSNRAFATSSSVTSTNLNAHKSTGVNTYQSSSSNRAFATSSSVTSTNLNAQKSTGVNTSSITSSSNRAFATSSSVTSTNLNAQKSTGVKCSTKGNAHKSPSVNTSSITSSSNRAFASSSTVAIKNPYAKKSPSVMSSTNITPQKSTKMKNPYQSSSSNRAYATSSSVTSTNLNAQKGTGMNTYQSSSSGNHCYNNGYGYYNHGYGYNNNNNCMSMNPYSDIVNNGIRNAVSSLTKKYTPKMRNANNSSKNQLPYSSLTRDEPVYTDPYQSSPINPRRWINDGFPIGLKGLGIKVIYDKVQHDKELAEKAKAASAAKAAETAETAETAKLAIMAKDTVTLVESELHMVDLSQNIDKDNTNVLDVLKPGNLRQPSNLSQHSYNSGSTIIDLSQDDDAKVEAQGHMHVNNLCNDFAQETKKDDESSSNNSYIDLSMSFSDDTDDNVDVTANEAAVDVSATDAANSSSHLDKSLSIVHQLILQDEDEYPDCNVPKHGQVSIGTLKKTKELQYSFDKVYNANKTWVAKLPFSCYVCNDDTLYDNVDILMSCDPRYKTYHPIPEKPFIFFDKEKYPITGGFKGVGFLDLRRDLGNSSSKNGYNICLATDYRGNKQNIISKKFICQCNAEYITQQKKTLDRSKLRRVSRQNDRKNNRKKGLNESRRIYTSKFQDFDAVKCPFHFLIRYNERGFYMRPGMGCKTHMSHVKMNNKKASHKSRNMSRADREDIIVQARAGLMTSHMKNLYHEKCKKVFSLQSYAYLAKCTKVLKNIDDTGKSSPSDRLIQYLIDSSYNFVILADKIHPITKEHSLISQTFLTDSGEKEHKEISYEDLPQGEVDQATEFAKEHRSEFGLSDQQQLLIAIAWVVPGEERMFSLYPRVLYMDTFQKSNKENRPLFTCTGKTTSSEMFTIMRVFMPNEQAWVFRWILKECFVKLFSPELLLKVKAIVSDGDSSEFGQIDSLIKHHTTNAYRIRCVWHIVDRSWHNMGPTCKNSYTPNQKEAFKEIKKTVKAWQYTWFKQGCYDEDAFRVSVHLFVNYVKLDEHKKRVTPEYMDEILDLVKRYVFPHHDRCVFYTRRYLDHSDDNSNSCHEGTNTAFVLGAAPCLPSSNIDTAGVNLSCNANRKVDELQRKNQMQEHSTRVDLKELGLDGLRGIVRKGQDLFLNEWNVRHKYKHMRFSKSVFLVTNIDNNGKVYQPKNRKAKYLGQHPKFIWVHKVYVCNGLYSCSCGHYERHGYPCRHVIHIVVTLCPSWTPTHHDFKVRWWDVYQSYMNTFDKNDSVVNVYDTIIKNIDENDSTGVLCLQCNVDSIPVTSITHDSPFKWDVLRCANYDISNIDMAKLRITTVSGLSETTVIRNENKEYLKTGPIEINEDLISQLSEARFDAQAEFEAANGIDNNNNNAVDERLGNAYQRYNPLCADLIRALESNTDEDLEKEIQSQLTKWIAKIHGQHHKKIPANGVFVSSSSASLKEKKKKSYSKKKNKRAKKKSHSAKY